MHFLAHLIRDERGGSIIEMGLAAPMLAAILIGMVDISNAIALKLQTTQVAHRAIERLVAQPNVTDAVLTTEAALEAGVEESAVTIDRWLECNGARQAAETTTCQTGEVYSNYTTVTVAKTYTPLLTSYFGTTISAEAGVRTR